MKALPPGSTIGILGGGQLGRMLAIAAAELGFDVHIYTPEANSPAARVAARTTVAAFDDADALARFASQVDVVTTEFENVPADATRALVTAGARVHPNPEALAIAQDRVAEKNFFNACGIATAPYAPVDSRADLDAALARIGAPAILKTRRLGYDGKGQARIATLADADAAYAALGGQPAILEGFCAFEREVSIVAARTIHNAFAPYDLVENVHAHGILHRTIAPARVDARVQEQAAGLASIVGDALDYAGVFAIEFFLMPDGSLIANEMAPRVHNSGHWTLDACIASQFEQHIRAVADWPLASPQRLCDAEMINLIGDDVTAWAALAAEPNSKLHLYGKHEARPGRKMGHVTRLKR
ncbi:MAG TPA: 5-(carboxyamino)imidazole ribonucleotide synthase [Caulobacterales bacterium]|nr:5-(carboxyamino)imidazole ribonucleotide synthase [Caulobacterales bacterium]